MKDTGC